MKIHLSDALVQLFKAWTEETKNSWNSHSWGHPIDVLWHTLTSSSSNHIHERLRRSFRRHTWLCEANLGSILGFYVPYFCHTGCIHMMKTSFRGFKISFSSYLLARLRIKKCPKTMQTLYSSIAHLISSSATCDAPQYGSFGPHAAYVA